MNKKEILNFIKENQIKFLETYFDIELYPYQKILMNVLLRLNRFNNDIKYNKN